MKKEHINRYGDKFTFTLNKDKDILWKGNFAYHRVGYANDYTEAYQAYLDDMEGLDEDQILSLEDFKIDVHVYFDNKYLHPDYIKLVKSLPDKIDMVDPSGGPYITAGSRLDRFGFNCVTVEGFKPIKNGYKIITKKCPCCDQKAGVHKFSCDTKRVIVNLK